MPAPRRRRGGSPRRTSLVRNRRALREVGRALGRSWRGGLVVHGGGKIERLEENVWAVPVDRLLV